MTDFYLHPFLITGMQAVSKRKQFLNMSPFEIFIFISGKNYSYRISGNFRENLIFAIFASDLKTRKYVSAKNCTYKES